MTNNNANQNVNIVLLICGPILIAAAKTKDLRERFGRVLSALQSMVFILFFILFVLPGLSLIFLLKNNFQINVREDMFTAYSVEPRNILPDILRSIEYHEIQSIQLPCAIRDLFQGRRDSSLVWAIIDGNGTYVYGKLKTV